MEADLKAAQEYVGTDEVSGVLQYEILTREGLGQAHHVLEVGCGCLSAGLLLIRWLVPDRYVGIDPNTWLREVVLRSDSAKAMVELKRPVFLDVLDFDASSLDRKFDLVLSHSILSHAAQHQLREFLLNTSKVLAPGGKIVASIRLAEGNALGSPGSEDGSDTCSSEWAYPGGVYFSRATIETTASELGLDAAHRPEHTEFYVKERPAEYHDWFVFTKK